MRYVPFIALAVMPLILWPSIWTVLAFFGLGIPVAIGLMPEEKPSELDPALWHSDPQVHAKRYAAAMAAWKARNSAWRW